MQHHWREIKVGPLIESWDMNAAYSPVCFFKFPHTMYKPMCCHKDFLWNNIIWSFLLVLILFSLSFLNWAILWNPIPIAFPCFLKWVLANHTSALLAPPPPPHVIILYHGNCCLKFHNFCVCMCGTWSQESLSCGVRSCICAGKRCYEQATWASSLQGRRSGNGSASWSNKVVAACLLSMKNITWLELLEMGILGVLSRLVGRHLPTRLEFFFFWNN